MSFEPPLIELVTHNDIFSTGVGKVEVLGPCVRFWMYSVQDSLGQAEPEHIVVAKIVMPLERVAEAIQVSMRGIPGCTLRRMPAPDEFLEMKRRGSH
ncbi:hypothetical protein IVB09_41450 [Bradyrhizobium sp. 174]|nr:hypothetical protein [Bradyrhizobium sp. 174]